MSPVGFACKMEAFVVACGADCADCVLRAFVDVSGVTVRTERAKCSP
jgi:hypothetical protein